MRVSDWRDQPRALLVAAIASAVLTALCILAIDQPVARHIAQYEPSAFWNRGIEMLEWTLGLPLWRFASSVFLVAGMVATMVVARWRPYSHAWIVVAGTHVICRFVTVKIKEATGRLRPNEWLATKSDETFGWEDGIAFPSGHVTLFASVIVPLAIVAPRTRPLLAVVVYVMVARIAINAHFVSDTLGSITLAAGVAWLLTVLLRRQASRR